MYSPVSILIYGRDAVLLETRGLILRRAGARVWTVKDLSELASLAPEHAIDLILLCHSLSLEQWGRALALANTRWPQARSLLMVTGKQGDEPGQSDQVIDARLGPAALVKRVAALLGPEHGLQFSTP